MAAAMQCVTGRPPPPAAAPPALEIDPQDEQPVSIRSRQPTAVYGATDAAGAYGEDFTDRRPRRNSSTGTRRRGAAFSRGRMGAPWDDADSNAGSQLSPNQGRRASAASSLTTNALTNALPHEHVHHYLFGRVHSVRPAAWNDMSHDWQGMHSYMRADARLSVVLLILVVVALLALALHAGPVVIFWTAFLAVLPTAVLLGDLTEMLAAWCGAQVGGLVNASLGNCCIAIIAILGLRQGFVGVVQSSLMGSIIGSILLVLGCAFIAGGISIRRLQYYDNFASHSDTMALMLGVIAISLPTAFHAMQRQSSEEGLLLDSRYTCIIMVGAYACFVVYELFWRDVVEPQSAGEKPDSEGGQTPGGNRAVPEEAEVPPLSGYTIMLIMLVAVSFIALFSHLVTSRLYPMCHAVGLSPEAAAIILLPFMGNVTTLGAAVMAATHDYLDLSVAVALNAAVQVIMFITPLAVFYGWAIGEPMSLDFQYTLVLGVVASVLLVSATLDDGVGHWLKGALLIAAYFLISGGIILSSQIAATVSKLPPGPPATLNAILNGSELLAPEPAVALSPYAAPGPAAASVLINGTDAS